MAATKITSRVLADDAVVRATLGDDAIGTAEIADDAVTGALIADDVALAGNPTTTTQSLGNSSTRLATTAFVQAAVDADIDALIDSAPGTMNTLDEIAAALNDDPTFTTTVNNAIALKAPLANPTFTGNATFDSPTLYVDGSNNRVGIGNTAPDVLLEVTGAHTSSIGMLHIDSSDHAFISLDAASSSHDKGIYFQEAGTATVIIDHDGSANLLRIHDGSNTHMVIQDDGKVGIGTTSPGTALEIASSGATEITISGGDTSYTNAGLVLEATNSTSYRGLGVFMHDAGGDHEWYAGTPYAASDQYQIGRQGTAAHAVSTAQTSLAFLTVKNDGKVGIGTASPSYTLDVDGTLGVTSTIRVTTDGSASAPCYQVGGDADTGMYQPTTNQLGFTVAGTQKAYFTTVAFNLDSSLTSGFGLGDNVPIKLGNSGDMEIYHDGSDNLIKSGDLRIWTPSFKVKSGDGSENMIVADENDSVELRYNGSKKIETTNTGIEVTGDINFTGTLREDGTEFSGGISTGKAIAMAIVFG